MTQLHHRLVSILLLSSFVTQGRSSDELCGQARDNFADSSALFILCAVENARPIKLCENCIEAYFNVVESYQNMSKITFNGTSCHDLFVNQDRLEIVESLYRNTEDLWSRGKCYDCYIYEDGKPTKHVSNNTIQFNLYHNRFRECVEIMSPSEELCSRCIHDYNVLDNYFTSISDVNEKISYCIDLVDVMNDTWTYWSAKCCKYRRHDEYIFVGLSVLVILLTISFYIVIQFCDEKKAPLIVPQTRFAESINSLRSEVGQPVVENLLVSN